MHRKSGFTLIELLIVVTIISALTSLAVPSLLRSRMTTNETAAMGALKTMAAAQTDYHNNASPHTYTGIMACLGSGNGAGGVAFLDPVLAGGRKSGYTFNLHSGPSVTQSIATWSATAWPIVYQSTGTRSFYIDDSGIIRGDDIGGGMGYVTVRAL